MVAIPTNLSFLGVAKETTKGTGAASTAFIPITQLDPHDIQMFQQDMGLRGAMVDVYGDVAGPVYAEIQLAGYAFPDTFPWLLANIMGDLVTTGGSAPYSHTMATKNSGDGQPGAISASDFYGIVGTHTRQFAGCQVGELSMKFAGDGPLMWTSKLTGFASTLVAKPTQSFTAITHYPGWLGTLNVGAANKLFLESGELNIKRNVNVIHTVDGSAAPYQIFVGPLAIDFKLTVVMEDDAELIRYLTAAPAATVLNWTTGVSAALTQIQCTMTKPQYEDAVIKRGKDFIELELTGKALANTTDVGASGGYGAAKFVVQNAVAASIYA